MEEDNLRTAEPEAKTKGGCPYTWGHCPAVSTESSRTFGVPSSTPHRCKGPERHIKKLHICAVCGIPGHRIQPLPMSQAGREFRAHLIVDARRKAAEAKGRAIIEAGRGK